MRHVLVPLSNILDCVASPRRFSIAARLVSLLYISECVASPHRFRFHYALAPLWEYGTSERSEASTALAQATHVACSCERRDIFIYSICYTYMEDFRVCHSFLSRTCVRGTKAGLASRTPKVHPDDVLCVSFRITIRNMRKGFSFHFSRMFT